MLYKTMHITAKTITNSLPLMEIILCMLGNFTFLFYRLLIFFKINFFKKFLSGIPSDCQTVWNQIRPDIMSGLIWSQTVNNGCQQTTLAGKEINQVS